RSNRKTYILVRNCREGSLFCDVHLITITQNKEHLFLSYCQSQVVKRKFGEVLRARKFYNQVKEIKIKLIVYNINKKVVQIICIKIRISTEPYLLFDIIKVEE
ncbi:MAG: hypothetical protein PHW84_08170, partial [Methanosarcina sp.]|nr:hypothetical protein [Methanosarcina sp.]